MPADPHITTAEDGSVADILFAARLAESDGRPDVATRLRAHLPARKLGSLYSGVGGLDWAAEQALDVRTAWQLDQVGSDVRRRHWPDALQVEADVRDVDPRSLPSVDVLCGGFPCQDLSCAGSRTGLAGSRTGLYSEMLRFAGVLRPSVVVMENVPGVLRFRKQIDEDWRLLGFGLTWVRARALDVGAPHIRARVFIVGLRGQYMGGVVEATRDAAWRPSNHTEDQAWNIAADELEQEEPWRSSVEDDEEDPDVWGLARERRAIEVLLDNMATPWPTPAARDHKSGSGINRRGTPPLGYDGPQYPVYPAGSRLNPDWVEALMGFPLGWTLPEGPQLAIDPAPLWPRGRYPDDWDRSQLWPGYPWEPARTLPDGPPCPGRPARLKAVGNAVCPQQGELSIRTAIDDAPLLWWRDDLPRMTRTQGA